MCLVRFENASKNYINVKFNLEINKGDLIIVTGINGSGKSTLIKLIIGYIKPDSGLLIKNTKQIAYLPENHIMPEFLTSKSYLNELMRINKDNINYTLYERLNIPNKKIKNLSKGNRQKLAIVGCLIGNNDIYVFDEPLSGLDQNSIIIFYEVIKDLQNKGHSIIISTHNKNAFNNLEYIDISLWIKSFYIIVLMVKINTLLL